MSITPQDNADTLAAFQSGALDGAWVPEPWATRLVLEGGGSRARRRGGPLAGRKVRHDSPDRWRRRSSIEHPDVVRDLIAGLGDAIDVANADPQAAQETVNAGIERITTKRLSPETIAGAWKNLSFTLDPIASSLRGSADDAIAVGALARAFAQDADILLMDEPFGALDAMTRDVLHDELDALVRARDLTVLFVTHNVREAARLADRIVVMSPRPGRVTAQFDVEIERPRRIDSVSVATLAATVTDHLREDVLAHAHR